MEFKKYIFLSHLWDGVGVGVGVTEGVYIACKYIKYADKLYE